METLLNFMKEIQIYSSDGARENLAPRAMDFVKLGIGFGEYTLGTNELAQDPRNRNKRDWIAFGLAAYNIAIISAGVVLVRNGLKGIESLF